MRYLFHAFRLKCTEAPEEPASIASEKILKVECNITITTNYMQNGILNVRDISLVLSATIDLFSSR